MALGKALFWDVATGSDGVACASCHFNAGADPRIKNQMDPGLRAKPLGDTVFGGAGGLMASGTPAGPNITLQAADFPFHQLTDPLDRESDVLFDENDVVSSQGALKGAFVGLRYAVGATHADIEGEDSDWIAALACGSAQATQTARLRGLAAAWASELARGRQPPSPAFDDALPIE